MKGKGYPHHFNKASRLADYYYAFPSQTLMLMQDDPDTIFLLGPGSIFENLCWCEICRMMRVRMFYKEMG
uniref:Bm13081 n=1 Tax=Brugia malayi TaxID=6279 RepID=A0A1I9GF23_BRUMA|nr:Bm13081 [Brugia malayi]